jgi:hypothetical protein
MAFVHVEISHGKLYPRHMHVVSLYPSYRKRVPAPTYFSSFISAPSPFRVLFVTLLTAFVVFLSCSLIHVVSGRYLDPDPLLLAAPHGSGDEVNSVNPRFHALNQALVQLVSRVATWHAWDRPHPSVSLLWAWVCER